MWIVECLAALILAILRLLMLEETSFGHVTKGLGGFTSDSEMSMLASGLWIHLCNPKTITDVAIASCNSILLHFHCAIKRNPLDLNWDDQKSKDMVENDFKVVKCMNIPQGYTSRLGI